MTTHSFRGQVRIQDIQDEFDALIKSINDLVDVYNQAEEALDKADFSNGKDQLSPAGYALTIGGLKRIIAAYQGDIWGCQVWKTANGCIITSGLWFRDDKVVPIPSGRITGTLGRYIDYNPSTETFTSSNTKSSNTIRCINPKRSIGVLHTLKELIAIHPTLKVFVGNNGVSEQTAQTISTDTEQFCCVHNGSETNSSSWWHQYLYFLGTLIEEDDRDNHKYGKFYMPWNHFWKPKGIANPFTKSSTHSAPRQLFKVFSVIKRV